MRVLELRVLQKNPIPEANRVILVLWPSPPVFIEILLIRFPTSPL
jgi:hypothetical protein